jgi:hypothetical protein
MLFDPGLRIGLPKDPPPNPPPRPGLAPKLAGVPSKDAPIERSCEKTDIYQVLKLVGIVAFANTSV